MEPNWNQRFGEPGFAYGLEPNTFLVSVAEQLPKGPILSLAEGEGRNAVYLAKLGFDVTAVDASEVGLAKAHQLAEDNNVEIKTVHADLATYEIAPDYWAAIVSIFCHIPPAIRKSIHAKVVSGLRPDGLFVLEAYTPQQCGRGTGGPPVPEMMMSVDLLKEELAGLQLVSALELERDVVEGAYHSGIGSVVQFIARRGVGADN